MFFLKLFYGYISFFLFLPSPLRQALYAAQTDFELPPYVGQTGLESWILLPLPLPSGAGITDLHTSTPGFKIHFCGTAMLSQLCLKSNTFLQLQQQ